MNDLSARRRCRYLHNTQQTQQTNTHALSWIRTCAPSNQSAAYICLRPQDHRDRLYYVYFENIIRSAVSLWRRIQRTEDIHSTDPWVGLWHESVQLVYIFTSYTTINITIHTIKCYKFNGYMFRSPLRPSSGQLLQIVGLQCAYNMGSHNV